jgi:hypothetical protein
MNIGDRIAVKVKSGWGIFPIVKIHRELARDKDDKVIYHSDGSPQKTDVEYEVNVQFQQNHCLPHKVRIDHEGVSWKEVTKNGSNQLFELFDEVRKVVLNAIEKLDNDLQGNSIQDLILDNCPSIKEQWVLRSGIIGSGVIYKLSPRLQKVIRSWK